MSTFEWKICSECGEEFLATHANQKACSDECKTVRERRLTRERVQKHREKGNDVTEERYNVTDPRVDRLSALVDTQAKILEKLEERDKKLPSIIGEAFRTALAEQRVPPAQKALSSTMTEVEILKEDMAEIKNRLNIVTNLEYTLDAATQIIREVAERHIANVTAKTRAGDPFSVYGFINAIWHFHHLRHGGAIKSNFVPTQLKKVVEDTKNLNNVMTAGTSPNLIAKRKLTPEALDSKIERLNSLGDFLNGRPKPGGLQQYG